MANVKDVIDIHKGEFIKIDNKICRVIEIDKKSGGAQFASIVHIKYIDLYTKHIQNIYTIKGSTVQTK